jgi:S1-C subfamily serine protease
MILTDSGTGSGVIVAKNKVVTNYHVAGSARQILVKYRSITYPATAGPAKPEWDVMLLDVPNLDAPSVAIKASGSLKVGQTAFALGAPKGLELSLSTGIVSALRFDNGYNIVQTSAPF